MLPSGPATQEADVLRAIIEAGATTLRLNFSHGTHDDHQRNIRLIRQISFELNQPVGILQDLQGPKIRLGRFEAGSIKLARGESVFASPVKTSWATSAELL